MFFKVYDLLLFLEEEIELDFGHGPCWPCFCLVVVNRIIKEQFLKLLPFFQNYSVITKVIDIDIIIQFLDINQ